MTAIAIKGAKKGQDKPRRPSIAKDSVASTSTAKLLYGLAEGEVWGLVDGGKSIRLDGTPLLDDNGNANFEGVTWDFRAGTNEQEYIKGFPDVSNETPINVELRSDTPFVKAFTDTQLSAIRVRFKWNRLSKTDPDSGDVKGYKIQYAIDLQTNGGAYVEVLNTKIEDKTSAGYERTHRIDLPRSTTGWQIRVRRLTPNDPSEYVQDDMFIDAVAEVIDVKLRYPNTALLGIQYNGETFGSIAKLEAHVRGAIMRVPSNYDAVARTYTGIWDGTFKDAYSNNPAWAYFYLCTQWRGGLGDRLDLTMIDKWSLYALGQYCDQMVSDGQGGLEPRFTCNVYLQKQADAYQVLQNIGGIFRAMSYWNGERIVLDADVPQDPVYTFSRANVIDGNFEYTGTRARDRHTLAKVAWDNPSNGFETEYEYIRDEKAMAKFGVKVLDLSAFGCTSQAQAQRAGLWALKTEQLETRQVSFGVGLDGFIPSVGNTINVSDELFAGRANGGRVSIVSNDRSIITIDRDITASIGDVLIVNGGNGRSERRTVSAISGRTITVSSPFEYAESENVWAIETDDLKLMRFRVMSIGKSDETTFAITAIQHEPQKYDAIDFGTDVQPTNITIVNPDVVDAPASVTITSRHRVVQGQTVTTLVIEWAQVIGAVAYDVEWRKDDGTWIKLPRTGNVSAEVEGVYSGNYMARVRSISAFDVQSNAVTSLLVTIEGKAGLPPDIVGLTATGVLFGMELTWGFQEGSGDAAYTEIETGSAPNTNVSTLGQYSYPTNTHAITGLQGGLEQSYRARLVDKLGFKSEWSDWVTATTDQSADKIMDLIQGQIDESALSEILSTKIEAIEPIRIDLNQEIDDRIRIVQGLSTQIALVSAGAGEQFDSYTIWHFDNDVEGWTGGTYNNGYIDVKSTANLVSPTIQITNGIAFDSAVYRHLKMRIERVGAPTWSGVTTWSGGTKTFTAPEFKDNIATLDLNTEWTGAITNFSIKLAASADASNYYKVDWIAVGRPSPAASYSALLSEKQERFDADQVGMTRIDGVIAQVGSDYMSGSTERWAGDDEYLAGSWSIQSAIIEEGIARATKDDVLVASINDNNALITNEQIARVDQYSSIASEVQTLSVNTGSNRADIENLQLVVSTPETGLAAKVTTLSASATNNAGAASAAQQAADAAATLAGNKGEVIFSSTEPSEEKRLVQNLWIDTSSGYNTPKRYAGGQWLTVTDNAAIAAKEAADTAIANAKTADDKAVAAQSAAEDAQEAADAALLKLTDISADGKLTAVEKKQVKLIWDDIKRVNVDILERATKYGVGSGSYTTAYSALETYLTPLLADINLTSNITRATFDSRFDVLFLRRATLDTAILDAIKLANDAAAQAASNAAAAAKAADDKAVLAQSALTEIAADNKLTAIEKKQLVVILADINKTDTEVRSNAAKYSVSLTAYNTAYSALTSYINPKLTDMTATSTIDRAVFNARFDTLYLKRSDVNAAIVAKAEAATAAAQGSANSAISAASAAQTTANSANASAIAATVKLTELAADDRLTPIEKNQVLTIWEEIKSADASVRASAAKYGVSTVTYDNVYTALNTYLTPLMDVPEQTSTIVRATFDGRFANLYARRAELNNAIVAATKAISDSLSNKLEPENLAVLVEGSGAFSDEFGGISGQFANFQGVVNGQKTAIETVTAVGNVEKLKNEIAKARLDKSVTSLNAQTTALQTAIDNYTTKIAELVVLRDALPSSENALRAQYNQQMDQLRAARTDAYAQQSVIADQVAQLNSEKAVLDSLKITETQVIAQHYIKMDSGGRIGGYGILQNSDATFDFAVNVDKFYIAPPTGTSRGKSPFMVLTTPTVINGTTVPAGTYMQSAFIHNGSIDTAQIRDAAIKSAQIDDLAVTTAKIDNLAVKSAQIDNLAVTSGKIANLAVDTLHIAGNAVTIPQAVDGAHDVSLGDSQSITAVTLALPTDKGVTSINFNTVLNFKVTVQQTDVSVSSTVRVYARIYENNVLTETDTLVWTQEVVRDTVGTTEIGTTVALTRHINKGVAKNIKIDLYATYDRLVGQISIVELKVLHTKLQAMTVRR